MNNMDVIVVPCHTTFEMNINVLFYFETNKHLKDDICWHVKWHITIKKITN